MNAEGETPKKPASEITCSLVRDRSPFRTAEIVDWAIPVLILSAFWLSP